MPPIERKANQELIRDLEVDDSTLDDDEPNTEELIEMLRQALHEANTGQTRPAEELLRELDDIVAEGEGP